MRLAIALLLIAGPAIAHDGEHDKWFANQHTSYGFPCCDRKDCRNVPAHLDDGHWVAWVDSATFPDEPDDTMGGSMRGHAPNDWVTVPDHAVQEGKDNPTPGSVLCWWNKQPLCFFPGDGA